MLLCLPVTLNPLTYDLEPYQVYKLRSFLSTRVARTHTHTHREQINCITRPLKRSLIIKTSRQKTLTKGRIAGADFSRLEKFNMTLVRHEPTRPISAKTAADNAHAISWAELSPKLSPPLEGLHPHLLRIFWAHLTQTRSVRSCFRAHERDQQTDRHTHTYTQTNHATL